jgi:amidohydrolase
MKYNFTYLLLLCVTVLSHHPLRSQTNSLKNIIDQKIIAIEERAVAWRHHLHQYPELSNREFTTAAYVETHLKKLGLDIRKEVAYTGLVAVLQGAKPGPVVALRADMDGLPIIERTDLPYRSKQTDVFDGEQVGVMHACGHDVHTASLMAAAEILSSIRDSLQGTIVFLFQPAEEGAPAGEDGGAELMIRQGALKDPNVDVIFGLHISSRLETGKVRYKPGPMLAAVNTLTIKVRGKGTHGASPWTGIDPIVASAQIILGLQTIISRQTDLTREPAVITIGKISGGVRANIIPDEVTMVGTIRTFDTIMQRVIHEKIRNTATRIAESMDATAEVHIDRGYPVTFNDHELTRRMLPSIFEAAGGEQNVHLTKPGTGAEDFAYFAQQVPGLYMFYGGMKPGTNPFDAPTHHTPEFKVEDESLTLPIRLFCYLALDYMATAQP